MLNNRKIGGIKSSVERWMKSNSILFKYYPNWYVGITSNPTKRKSNHKSKNVFGLNHFKFWDAGTVENARAIEEYFGANGKGMEGGRVLGGATKDSRFVYIYK